MKNTPIDWPSLETTVGPEFTYILTDNLEHARRTNVMAYVNESSTIFTLRVTALYGNMLLAASSEKNDLLEVAEQWGIPVVESKYEDIFLRGPYGNRK